MADTGEQGQRTSQDANWGADLQLRSQASKSHISEPGVISLKSVECMWSG